MRQDGEGFCVPAEDLFLFPEGWVGIMSNEVGK